MKTTTDEKIYKVIFDTETDLIHYFAVSILLSNIKHKFTLSGLGYEYSTKGSGGGYLYYRKKGWSNWVMISNWCFYGLYIVVYFRKTLWLRSLYNILFKAMGFASINFFKNYIELIGKDGSIIKISKLYRFTSPGAFEEIMTKKFGYSIDEIKDLKMKLKW